MTSSLRVAFNLLFFLSGAAGLLYEVLWLRMLSLTFGATTFAISIILSSFMAGLALGSEVGGRLAPRLAAPARAYGLLEGVIGLYALALPLLIPWVAGLYRGVYLALEPGPVTFGLMQGALLFVLLLVPTSLMGATFPLLVQAVAPRTAEVGAQVGRLYAANGLGAMVGCLVTGFVLLPELGVERTTWLAVAVNLAVGLLAALLGDPRTAAGWEAEALSEPGEPAPAGGVASIGWRPLLWAGAALTGAAGMIYEVAWHRLLALQLGSSVYAFSAMLGTFLLGLGLGGGLASWWLGRRPGSALAVFVVAEGLAALLGAASVYAFPEIPVWYVRLYQLLGTSGTGFGVQIALGAVVMLPAATAMGAALPCALAAAGSSGAGVTREVARVYVSNTFGAILGSLLAGFVLLPEIGLQQTLGVAVSLNLMAMTLVGALVLGVGRRLVGVAAGAILALVLLHTTAPTPNPLLMAAGFYRFVNGMESFDREKILDWALDGSELLFYKDGLTSTVTVGQSKGTTNRWLANNGKVDASTHGDLSTQLMVSHIPLLFHPDPKRALVIGLASGISLGAATRYPLESVEVLEIEEAIIEASHFFDEWNHRPLEDRRVKVVANDARNHLVLTDQRWDVIISEPSNPWVTGVSNLFTLEFWQLAASRLSEGGILCQWMQVYDLPPVDFKVLLRTFHEVFPYVLVLGSMEDADLVVLGSMSPITPRPDRLELMMARKEVREDLARIDIDSGFDVLTWLMVDQSPLAEALGEGPLNTDDNAWIEFRAPLALHAETADENLRLIEDRRTGPEAVIDAAPEVWGVPDVWLGMGEAYRQRKFYRYSEEAYRRYLAEGGELTVFETAWRRLEESRAPLEPPAEAPPQGEAAP